MVKSRPAMWETRVWFLVGKIPWRIPWTEEPGELQFMGSQRVRHDWATNAYTHTHIYTHTHTHTLVFSGISLLFYFVISYWQMMLNLFSYAYHLFNFFDKISVHIFWLFLSWAVFLLLNFRSSFHNLNTSSPSGICFENLSLWLFSYLLTVSFIEQLILIRSDFSFHG